MHAKKGKYGPKRGEKLDEYPICCVLPSTLKQAGWACQLQVRHTSHLLADKQEASPFSHSKLITNAMHHSVHSTVQAERILKWPETSEISLYTNTRCSEI
jgi:hypothetical protein